MRRVVVTGFGIVSPVGVTADSTFANIIAGRSGVGKISLFDTSNFETKIAAEVKFKTEQNNGEDFFDPAKFVAHKDLKKLDRFMLFAIAAAEEALAQAGWKPTKEEELFRTSVTIGSGVGGLDPIQENSLKLANGQKISPFFIPSALINLASGHVAIKYGFLGSNHAAVTACATGAHAIYNAAQMIMLDDADVVVCGGAESTICEVGIAGFNAAKALSTKYNNDPEKASRPWDENRDGFVMAEGAGVLVLEEYEHAKKRGANIICEYLGAGLSCDAYHITAPEPTGLGARLAMQMAIKKARIDPGKIGYVNAHGTSTPLGDNIEMNAVKEILAAHFEGRKIPMSSTKSSTGHMIGAAGSVEAIISIMAMNQGILPPTLNLENPIPGSAEFFDLVPHAAKEAKINYILSNSFGFGGTNASLIFGKI